MSKAINEIGNRYGKLLVVERFKGESWQAEWVCLCDCGKKLVIKGGNLRKGVGKKLCECSKRASYEDFSGRTFGRLKVTGIHINHRKRSERIWECVCECGGVVFVNESRLVYGKTTSCGCLRHRKDITGKRYGKLVAIERVYVKRETKGAMWFFKCDCGNNKVLNSRDVLKRNGGTRSCGCLSRRPPGEAGFNKVLYRLRKQADERGYAWELTDEKVKELTSSDCYYCGGRPEQISAGRENYLYNGIDRVDNGIGYVEGNCVSCCGRCNHSKSKYSVDDFREWIRSVYFHFAK